MNKRVIINALISGLLISTLVAQTPQAWDSIHIGQTTTEVHQILGEPQFKSQGNHHSEVWTGDFSVSFADGKVVFIKRQNVAVKAETETIFMPIAFGPGNTIVFTFENSGTNPHDLMIQRFSADGTVMDSVVRTAGPGSTELRLEVPLPERGSAALHSSSPYISFVTPGMPAYKAGLRKDDQLISVNGKQIAKTADVQAAILSSEGKPFEVIYKRGDILGTTTVTPELLDNTRWVAGIMVGGLSGDGNIGVGWIRVVEEGNAVVVSGISETIADNKLEQYNLTPANQKYTDNYDMEDGANFCQSARAKDFKCNGTEAAFFINLSDNPVRVGMCFDNPGCTPSSTETVAPHAMISFPNMRKQRMTLKTTPGYSVASAVWFGEGSIKTFDATSTITFHSDDKKK